MARQVLEVFLSSTAVDLAPYRDAVYARLARIEIFDCLRQEDFGARSADAVAFCSEKARAADLFIGLVGMRRGWEPEGDNANRSITEIKHDCAKEAGRPRFIWVSPDNFAVPGNLRESEEQHQRQLAFRKSVMAGGEIIVSQEGFSSPGVLASTIVEQLLTHVMSGDLIAVIRPEVGKPKVLQELPDAIVSKLLALLDARGEVAKAASGGLEPVIIAKLAKRLKPNEALDFDQAVAALENAVGIALDSIARGERGTNEGDFVKDVRERVAERTKAGEFDHAAKEVDAALAELDRREIAQRDALQRSRITLLEAGVEQDILRRDASAVARRVKRIAAIQEPEDSSRQFATLRTRQGTFLVEGRDKGFNFSLEIAIEIARLMLNYAGNTDQRGTALNDLGISLRILGARESGTTRLEEAVTACRDALKEYMRERAPLDWAMTQNNLGNALRNLGQRASGTARLEEAVTAYRDALKERARERVPLDWAMTQNNLGLALQILGEREIDTARLEEAVTAYRDALKERTRERVPLAWAITQNNLGNALAILGERESSTERLKQALQAYRAAVEAFKQSGATYYLEIAQGNLGRAEAEIASRQSKGSD
jgi:tetratricopeptide (TPR) repeat protein